MSARPASAWASEVKAAVAALNAMTGGRYQALEDARRAVARQVAEELAGTKMTPVPLALPLAEVREGLFLGGKAEKLGELTRLGLTVPRGFGVSAYAQKLFFQAEGLEEFIRKQISQSHIRDLESLREAGEAIRERIMAQELPPELSRALAEQLAGLTSDRVAVRSSALQEDSQFSFAGQFETILNVPREQVEPRYKEVIASQFTPRALYYCHTSGFSYQELAMGVLVMEMVPVQGGRGALHLGPPGRRGHHHQLRLRPGVPGGGRGGGARHLPGGGRPSGGPARGRKDPHARARPRKAASWTWKFPRSCRGPALPRHRSWPSPPWGSRSGTTSAAPRTSNGPCPADGGFYLLQARPLRMSRQLKADYLPPRIKGAEVLLEKGIIASRGAAAGPVHFLKGEPLQEIPPGVVLVTDRALPEYGLAVGRVAAMISEAGSATSHLATVLREARVPAIFGARGATGVLKEGGHGDGGRLLRQRLRRPGGGAAQGAPGRRRGPEREPGLQGAGARPEAHHPPQSAGPPGGELPPRILPHLPRPHPLRP